MPKNAPPRDKMAASFRIDDALARFVESGVAALVGTASDDGIPHVVYGWAPRVTGGGAGLEVFIDTERSGTTLANLRENGMIAITAGDPLSYRSVQFKGRVAAIEPASEADGAWVAAYREAFMVNTSLVGDPPAVIRNLWLDDVLKVAMTIERAFDQTPGPAAGQPL